MSTWREAFRHFCEAVKVASCTEAAPFVPWNPQKDLQVRFWPEGSQDELISPCREASGDLVFAEESGATAPPACAVHLQRFLFLSLESQPLDPNTQSRESEWLAKDAKDRLDTRVTCCDRQVIDVISQFAH